MKSIHNRIMAGVFSAILLSTPLWAQVLQKPSAPATPSLIERYRQALAIDPDNLTLRYYLGVALLFEGRADEALPELKRAYPAFSELIEMNYNLGIALTRTGDADSAQLYLEQAEALGALQQPEIYPLPSAYYNLGLLYLDEGGADDALGLFSKVLSLVPDRLDLYRLIGEIMARQRRNAEAVAAYSRYLEAFPDDAEVREYLFALHFNQGLQELEQKRVDLAQSAFDKALEISPASPMANYYQGYIAYQRQDWEGAIERLSGSYTDYSDDLRQAARTLLYNSALTLLKDGLPEEALEAVTRLVETHPDDLKVLYLAGNTFLALKENIVARQYYEDVLALDPSHQGALLNLVAAEKGLVEDYITKGQVLFRQERYREAAVPFEAALGVDPANELARAYLDEVHAEIQLQGRAYFDAARTAINEGDYQGALKKASLGLEWLPESEEGQILLEQARTAAQDMMEKELLAADRALKDDDLVKAETAYQRILALDPQSAEAISRLKEIGRLRQQRASKLAEKAASLLEQGQIDEARQAYGAALTLQPQHPESLAGQQRLEATVDTMVAEQVKWARRATGEGKLGLASEHYRSALKYRVDSAIEKELQQLELKKRQRLEGLLAAARAEQGKGDLRRSRSLLQRAVAQAPEHPEVKKALGLLRAATQKAVAARLASAVEAQAAGEVGLAMGLYRKVLDVDPDNASALSGLEVGRESLRAEVEKLVTQSRDALADKQLAQAESLVNEALSLDPYSADARSVAQRVTAAFRRQQEGVELVDLEQMYLEGIQLYTQGQYPQALEVWEKLLSVAPEHEKARRNIEKARRKLKKIQERRNG